MADLHDYSTSVPAGTYFKDEAAVRGFIKDKPCNHCGALPWHENHAGKMARRFDADGRITLKPTVRMAFGGIIGG